MAFTVSDLPTQILTGSVGNPVITVTASVGDLLVVEVAANNAGTNGAAATTVITDAVGNTYTQRAQINRDPGAANEGATLTLFTGVITNAITGQNLTCTFTNGQPTRAVLGGYKFVPGAGETASYISTDTTGTSGSGTASSIVTTSITSGDTVVGAIALESDAAITGDSDTSNGSWSTIYGNTTGSGNAGMQLRSQYKTVSATATQTYNNSWTGANDYASTYVVVRSAASGVSGSASQSLSIAQDATSTVAVAATSSSALSIGQSTTGTVAVVSSATQSLSVAQSSVSKVAVAGTATQSLSINQTAEGTVIDAPISATATQSLSVSQSATSTVSVTGSATQSLSIAQSAPGTVAVVGSATQSLGIAQSVSSKVAVAAQATQSLTIGQSAVGLTASAAAEATQSLSIAQTSTATVSVASSATQTLSIAQSATSTVSVAGSATQSLSVSQSSAVTVSVTATATQSITINQSFEGETGGAVIIFDDWVTRHRRRRTRS